MAAPASHGLIGQAIDGVQPPSQLFGEQFEIYRF
jgi:hypothetical protein